MKTVVKTHIGAYGILIRDGKTALIKKARGGYKGKYDLPGGGIEHNLVRGGSYYRGLNSGVSAFTSEDGYSKNNLGFRLILTPTL